MSSLSSDVTNAVWHAYHYHHEILGGQVSRTNLTNLISRIGHVIGAPLVAHTLTLPQTPLMHFGQLMCFLEKELFAPFQVACDIKSMQRCRDLIEEACWQEFSPSVMKPRANNTNPLSERAVYHIFRVFCFLAELKTDPLTGTVHVTISPEEAEEFSRSFVQSLGEPWDASILDNEFFSSEPSSFNRLLTFVETRLAAGRDPRGLAEAAAELFDVFIGDVIKKGPVKRRMFGLWWEYVMVVRPHFLQFYNNRGKKVSEWQLTSTSCVKSTSCCSNPEESTSNFLPWAGLGQTSTRGHKLLIFTKGARDEATEKVLEISAPCYKSKLQWISAIQCAIAHSHSQRRYQSYLASQRRILRHEQRVEERAKKQELERSIRLRIKQELSPLESEIDYLKQKVEEETKAKRDEEIVRGAQSRLLVEEWEKIEKLQQELEATKQELKQVKSETVCHRRSRLQRSPLYRAKSWSDFSGSSAI